jgi:bacterioferritin (cytochrome b1)
MGHFHLIDTGEAEFEEFDQVRERVLFEEGYPNLDAAVLNAPPTSSRTS